MQSNSATFFSKLTLGNSPALLSSLYRQEQHLPLRVPDSRRIQGRVGFKPHEWQTNVYNTYLKKRDALLVIRTGAGKSAVEIRL